MVRHPVKLQPMGAGEPFAPRGLCWGLPDGRSPGRRFWNPVTGLLLPTDNLWSAYTDKGAFVERKGTPSVPVPEESRASGLPYVLTDIMTYFTMLVGIYFPSVTGEALPCPSTVYGCPGPPGNEPPGRCSPHADWGAGRSFVPSNPTDRHHLESPTVAPWRGPEWCPYKTLS